jgi:hypothetical protein
VSLWSSPLDKAEELTRHPELERTLSDYSDYDSSDSEYQARVATRSQPRRGSMAAKKPTYDPLSDDEDETPGVGGDPNDPFADPTDFLGSIGGSGSKSQSKERMECE